MMIEKKNKVSYRNWIMFILFWLGVITGYLAASYLSSNVTLDDAQSSLFSPSGSFQYIYLPQPEPWVTTNLNLNK